MGKTVDRRVGGWLALPKSCVFRLNDRAARLQAQIWVACEQDYEAYKAFDREVFAEFVKSVAEKFKGYARASTSGGGAWEDGKPWARLVSSQTFVALDYEDHVPKDERQINSEREWAGAMVALAGLAERHFKAGSYLIMDQKLASAWASEPASEREALAARLASIDEAAELARVVAAAGPAPAKPRL